MPGVLVPVLLEPCHGSFRRPCVSFRLSFRGWRAKQEVVPRFFTAFSSSLVTFSELVNSGLADGRNSSKCGFRLGRLARVDQSGLSEVTHFENGIGNRSEIRGLSSTPQAC